MVKRYFTSESVTEGHPDKMADQIADAILDDILLKDPFARVACEAMQVGGQAVLGRQYSFATPWLTERHGYDPT